MIIEQGKIINIQVYKYDGTLYRQWNGIKIVKVNPNLIVLFMYKTKVLEHSKQKWVVKEPMLWFFPKKDKFYNTTVLIRKSGFFYYTNLASPPLFEDNTLKFIDYDLDIKAYPKTSVKIVDKAEYERNKIKYSYPPQLIKVVQSTSQEIIQLIQNKEGFFNEKVIHSHIRDLFKHKILVKRIIK